MNTLMLGAIDPNCLKKENCKPQCVRTFIKFYGLDVQNFAAGADGKYEDCIRYENCKPQCIASFKNNSQGASYTNQAANIIASGAEIDQQIQSSKNRSYLMIGIAAVVAGGIVILAR